MNAIEQLEKKYPFLVNELGGSKLLESYLSKYKNYYFDYLYPLLTYKDSVTVVNPWNASFYIDSSINNSEPYTVVDAKGNILYSVSNHQGIFGRSQLDKLLINQSNTIDIYYIQYHTLTQLKLKVIVVNKNVTQLNPQSSTRVQTSNQLILNIVNGYRNTSLSDLPFLPITITTLPIYPSYIPTAEEVFSNPQSIKQVYDPSLDPAFLLNIQTSQFLTISQTSTTEYFLSLSNIIGSNPNRLILVSPNVYYIATSDEITYTQLTNLFSFSNSYNPNYEDVNINLSADITI